MVSDQPVKAISIPKKGWIDPSPHNSFKDQIELSPHESFHLAVTDPWSEGATEEGENWGDGFAWMDLTA